MARMANEEAGIKVLTLEEANALLPLVRASLETLREKRSKILRTQAQIEIEEMTGADKSGDLTAPAQKAVVALMEDFHGQTRALEQELEKLLRAGAQLKDLDSGLVDFYSRRDGETVFLCWKEGEADIRHWHSLTGGFQNRRPLV
ncbi:MAG TPA: DUF2203 domain-containing protein [bacterium]|nr:DUF2203 domain-containing protein [bacterium]